MSNIIFSTSKYEYLAHNIALNLNLPIGKKS